MLPISVNLDVDIVSMPVCVFVSRLHSTSDTEVSWKVEHVDSVFFAYVDRMIGRPIVDNNVVISVLLCVLHY